MVGNVTLSGHILRHWVMYGMPLNHTQLLEKMMLTVSAMKSNNTDFAKEIINQLIITKAHANFWAGKINITCGNAIGANDTFLRLDGWSKGVAFINGFNLGRYWPVMGPQVLYTFEFKISSLLQK